LYTLAGKRVTISINFIEYANEKAFEETRGISSKRLTISLVEGKVITSMSRENTSPKKN